MTAPKGSYHAGWYVRKHTAVFQFRRCIDDLNCEIVEYLGLRETTKAAARERLRGQFGATLEALREAHPKYNLQNIVIE